FTVPPHFNVTTAVTDLGSSNDILNGGEGNDTMYGWTKTFTTTLIGTVLVNDGQNMLDGGPGEDIMYGDFETLNGNLTTINALRDTINGGNGNTNITPTLNGNNDTIDGGNGFDQGDAGPGSDTCTNTEGILNCE
ncbi:hypothetical protein, partial [Bacillus wiedmannii]|uniref:hypothetical protein n=1 Tax=Bacillus wiedmannii TaxID=1890302 RepID=UPI002E1BCF6B|nr:hypothetical protein [Bacillus wiedmannii]